MDGTRIIVIGASAGGLTALRRIFSELDRELPATTFVVLHSAPSSRYLATILGAGTKLPVHTAADGPFEKGAIYVAAADHHLMVERDRMRLAQGPKENLHRPSIDVLFRSAAYAYRHAVIGVVLTGMLDDGTAGLFDVKRHGGTTVVQDPNDAEYKSMPISACTHVKVDHSVPLSEIAALLNRLARYQPAPLSIPPAEDQPSITDSSVGSSVRDEDAKMGTPSRLFTCPECQGPLVEISNGGMLRFRCRAGHAFGLASMTFSQAERTEQLLWSALQSLKATSELEQTMKQAAEVNGDQSTVRKFDKRCTDTRRGVELLEEVLRLTTREENGG